MGEPAATEPHTGLPGARRWWAERGDEVLLVASLTMLVAGGLAFVGGARSAADALWNTATVLGLVLSFTWTAQAMRERRPTVDVIAVLALAGALVVGEPFAGAVITLMLTN